MILCSNSELGAHVCTQESGEVSVSVIPRSREVGQSYITSVATTLYSLLIAAWIVLKHRPQLVGGQPKVQLLPSAVLKCCMSCLSTISCLLCWWPLQVLVNGPGTCIPVCAAAFVYRWAHIMAIKATKNVNANKTDQQSCSLLFACE